MDLNKVMIIGNVTRDPEAKTTPQGTNVTSFSIATNMVWTDKNGTKQEKVEFHNIVAWRKLAEICSQYLKKGSKVYIEGRLQTRNWDDPSGVKKYRTEIIAENMIMLDRAQGGGNQSASFSNNSDASTAQVEAPSDEEEINVDEIPF